MSLGSLLGEDVNCLVLLDLSLNLVLSVLL
jgi:hypothetical protein